MTERHDKAIRDGNRAKLLLDDPVLIDAIAEMETRAIAQLINCPPNELIEARAIVQAIQGLRPTLQAIFDGGKVAAFQLAKQKEHND